MQRLTRRAAQNEGGNFDAGELMSLTKTLALTPATPLGIAQLCDLEDGLVSSSAGSLNLWLTKAARRLKLQQLLTADKSAYLETATFLGGRLPRSSLPNRQDLSMGAMEKGATLLSVADSPVQILVPDCALTNVTLAPSPLDQALLWVFRKKVREETGWASETEGLSGLLEEGQRYMLSQQGTPEAQQAMVKTTLAWLMTPFLPPFYRLFMSGLVPSEERGDPEWLVGSIQKVAALLPGDLGPKYLTPGNQLGPWFYAPALTSFVTPTFFGFLVGPSTVNFRQDGALGGLVVEKCSFLQESGCKGLCLNQCKLPAQSFFKDTLGLPLTVQPNFETQECQWSFGEEPVSPEIDPTWPKGCLKGCPTRAEVQERKMELACE